jgi:hypothetical protein
MFEDRRIKRDQLKLKSKKYSLKVARQEVLKQALRIGA